MSNIKVITRRGNSPGMKTLIFAGVHGDEICGVKAFNELVSEIDVCNGEVTFIVANLEADRQNKRFIEYNLNRCFLDNQTPEMENTLEGRTAKEIIPFLKDADALLDLHSSDSSDSLKYLICEENCLDIASCLSPENVITGIDSFHPGSSDGYMYNLGKVGICIECGLDRAEDSVETAKEAILDFLSKTGNIRRTNEKKILKRKFRSNNIYKNRNGPFKLERDFKDFEKMSEKTLIGYDGDEKIYLEEGDVIMFPHECSEIGNECFLVINEEFS